MNGVENTGTFVRHSDRGGGGGGGHKPSYKNQNARSAVQWEIDPSVLTINKVFLIFLSDSLFSQYSQTSQTSQTFQTPQS